MYFLTVGVSVLAYMLSCGCCGDVFVLGSAGQPWNVHYNPCVGNLTGNHFYSQLRVTKLNQGTLVVRSDRTNCRLRW